MKGLAFYMDGNCIQIGIAPLTPSGDVHDWVGGQGSLKHSILDCHIRQLCTSSDRQRSAKKDCYSLCTVRMTRPIQDSETRLPGFAWEVHAMLVSGELCDSQDRRYRSLAARAVCTIKIQSRKTDWPDGHRMQVPARLE